MAFTYGSVFATGVPLNAGNMNKCLLGYGLYADFPTPAAYVSPASPGNAGMLALATDQGELYYSNGTSWVFVSYTSIPVSVQSYPTRIMGATYQNTTGKVLIVNVSIQGPNAGAGRYLSFYGNIQISSPPGNAIARFQADATNTSPGGCMTLIVPNNYYYSVIDLSSPAASVSTWNEQQLG